MAHTKCRESIPKNAACPANARFVAWIFTPLLLFLLSKLLWNSHPCAGGFNRLVKQTALLVRAAAATCLILLLVGWSDALQARDQSFSGVLVLGFLAAIYLWLTFFPRGREEEAIGSCIGLAASVFAVYTSKLGIIFVLIVPSVARTSFGYVNLFLLVIAIAVWALNFQNLQHLQNCVGNVCCSRSRWILDCVVA